MTDILETIDRLKRELDALRPLPAEAVARVAQKCGLRRTTTRTPSRETR